MKTNSKTTNRWKIVAGDVTVAVVLMFALWMSYGCGSDEPQVVRTPATNQPTSTPRVAPASYEPAPVEEPVRTAVSYEEAEGVFRDKRYDEATDLFLLYVSNHPDNVWGHYMTGLSAWKSGVLAQAETSFEHALELDSNHVKSLTNLSRVYLEQGRPEDAMRNIERVLAIEPESVDGFRLKGRAHEELGEFDSAIESYRQAIMIDPEDAWSMNNLGLVMIRDERFDEASRVLALAVEIRNDVPLFFNNLGIALERIDEGHAAAEAYDRAIELDPAYEKAQQNLARVGIRNAGTEIRTVDLSVLADEFRRQVNEWIESREAVTDPMETALRTHINN